VVMEGYLDVARAIESGIGEAVATCGTALTPSHARLLRRFAERVVVNFDQDEAGRKAARRSLEMLLPEGLRLQVVTLPEGHDPDSFLKAEGAAAYRKLLDQAADGLAWHIESVAALSDTQTPGGKAAFFEAVLPVLLRVESRVEQAAWLTRAVERGGLDERAAREMLRRARVGAGGAPIELATPPPRRAELVPAERWLLTLLVQGAEDGAAALAELTDPEIEGLASAPALKAAKAVWRRGQRVDAAAIEAEIQDAETRGLLTALAVEAPPGGGISARDCVRELKSLPLKRRLREIQGDLVRAEGAAVDALLTEKLRITRQIASS
jgi:DNA primase